METDTDWMAEGRCRNIGLPTEVFYPDDVGMTHELTAKAVCRPCSVRGNCLEFAIANNEDGIWGGTTPGERAYIVQRRRRFGHISAPNREPTQADVAALARCTQSQAAKALLGRGGVGPTIVAKVHAAAAELGYTHPELRGDAS